MTNVLAESDPSSGSTSPDIPSSVTPVIYENSELLLLRRELEPSIDCDLYQVIPGGLEAWIVERTGVREADLARHIERCCTTGDTLDYVQRGVNPRSEIARSDDIAVVDVAEIVQPRGCRRMRLDICKRARIRGGCAAGLDSLLLTAGHDVDALQPPLVVDRSMADERFVGLGGREQVVRAGDMLMRDQGGIISAVVYGPDQRTRLVGHTRRALLTTYAPAGIGADQVLRHLDQLAALVRLAAPEAEVRLHVVCPG